jgi:uncharacterized membrane protein
MFYFKKSNLWVAPVSGTVIALALAIGTLYLDNQIEWKDPPVPFFRGSSDSARDLLSVIATSVTTLLALIFTIIVVAIQLVSGQYNPRTTSSLLQDRPSHITIGIFVGTFTYTLVILWGIRFTETVDEESSTGISLSLAFLFAIVSLGNFAIYSNHIIQSVRITSLINRIGEETRKAIKRIYIEKSVYKIKICQEPQWKPDHVLYSQRVGVIVELDAAGLLKKAIDANSIYVLTPKAGAFVPEGVPLIKVYGSEPDGLLEHVKILGERTMDKDILYGIRQLVDIAIRANSTGINDPATAVQVLDQLHDLMRRLLEVDMGHLIMEDEHGKLRVLMKLPSWEDVVQLVSDEIRLSGGSSLHVVKRLKAMLEDLHTNAPKPKRELLKLQLDLLDETISKNFDSSYIQNLARKPDIRGAGF